MRNVCSIILIVLLICVILIVGCTGSTEAPQPSPTAGSSNVAQTGTQEIVGHMYEIRGQYYDSNPSVPLIQQSDVNVAAVGSAAQIVNYYDYQDLYNQYNYRCNSLKNEGTAAFTTAQSAAAGTANQEQMLNYYSMARDAIQREANCQESITIFQNHALGVASVINNWNQLNNELNQNMQISRNDENTEITNYNNLASNFNNAISSCSNSNQVIGNDGMCHDICVAPNIYCE